MKKNLMRIVSLSAVLLVFSMIMTGSLTVTASSGTVYESEPNNTAATANMTYDDYDSYGTISSASDVDWWKVTFSSEGIANFYLGSIPSGCNYQLCVYNYTGNVLLVKSLRSSNSSELCKVHVRAGEAYYIKIYSASGYSSTDTYKFRFKRYDLNGARIFTCSYINNGHNESGANDWNPVVSGMGFSSSVLLGKNAAYVYSYMPDYSIVMFNTHGTPGEVRLHSSANLYTSLFADDTSVILPDRAIGSYPSSSSLSNNVLVIYDTCESGCTDSVRGNLVNKTISKGAFCCIGWNQSIPTDDANLWVKKFLTYCANGKNVSDAISLTNDWVDTHQTSFYDPNAIKDINVGSSRTSSCLIG